MRLAIAVLSLVVLAAPGRATDPSDHPPPKPPTIVREIPDAVRQGGDSIADATVIPAIPYLDGGTTAGYEDDSDEVCPVGSEPFAPDVVYTYTPLTSQEVTIDLCGSQYDTKVYVYDATLHLIACNDDYYYDEVCGLYTSKIERAELAGGEPHYIVVDGYSQSWGNYLFEVTEYVPCILDCPPGGVAEGEPPLVDGYEDAWNGGCNSPGFGNPFQAIAGDANGGAVFCGVAGWYMQAGSPFRDTDWFTVVMGPTGVIDVTVDAEEEIYLFELAPQDCDEVAVAQLVTGGPCETASMTITGYGPGQVVWIWAGATQFEPPGGFQGNEYDYVLWLSGLAHGVATEATSWSRLRALYD